MAIYLLESTVWSARWNKKAIHGLGLFRELTLPERGQFPSGDATEVAAPDRASLPGGSRSSSMSRTRPETVFALSIEQALCQKNTAKIQQLTTQPCR